MSKSDELVALSCYFNPCRSQKRYWNYGQYRDQLAAQGIRTLTVELAFDDQPYELDSFSDLLQLRGGDVMWQKERLLQVGIEHLVDAGVTKIAWLDADMQFTDSHWAEHTLKALEQHAVVQCFDHSSNAFEGGYKQQVGVVSSTQLGTGGHHAPGLAWAAHADFLMDVGLYQHGIVGGGDSWFWFGLESGAAAADREVLEATSPAFREHFRRWAVKAYAYAKGRVGFVTGHARTLSHGTRARRRYRARHGLLWDFDPDADIAVDRCGAWRWTDTNPVLRRDIVQYFRQRNEDVGTGSTDDRYDFGEEQDPDIDSRWTALMERYKDTRAVRVLELGGRTGRTTLWLLNNLIWQPDATLICLYDGKQAETQQLEANVAKAGRGSQAQLTKGAILQQLGKLEGATFDVIVINRVPEAGDIYRAMLVAWRMLAPRGLLILLHYDGDDDEHEIPAAQRAGDQFMAAYRRRFDVLEQGQQLILRKRHQFGS